MTHIPIEEYDLSRHGVVEASAGTGKTHTIEELVRRLLIDAAVSLEQILVVTFTEKAAGELKTRLRTALERAQRKQDENEAIYSTALAHFDQAPIFTIHGFCQRLSQEYALEQGQDFQLSLANDLDLLEELLREIQRKDWRQHFGPRLRAVLEAAGYDRSTASEWDKKVLQVASRYKPLAGHQLRPPFVTDWWQRLDEAGASWAGQLDLFTINLLIQRLREHKQQRGMQSFDDMIADVVACLDPVQNEDAERFANTLRERYRFGIVDEFQDTDPLQWRIFRRIFLEGGTSKLFVVGDPKQAIFGFRGADLPTYLHAVDEMKSEFRANAYPLVENWRSEPDLLDAFNSVFNEGEWFGDSGITYVDVHPPDDDKRQTRLESDRSNRAALTMVDVTEATTMKLALKQFARFTVQEIQRLLNDRDGPQLTFSIKRSEPKAIDAGDICILVRKRPEAEPITQQLDLAGIPYSFYKQVGLWQSDEATHVEILLHTLANPEDTASFRKALLTCFFRVRPEELARTPEIPLAHPARQLYQAWLADAEERRWSALCTSLIEDTGLLFERGPDSYRRLTNLRQILTTLEQIGHGFHYDLVGLLDWLHRRRQVRDNETEAPAGDLDRPRVKIMTIHASKGLEFPIVFMAGGFTASKPTGPATYRDDQERLVFDLLPEDDAWERVAREQRSEEQRLFYVALTRAVFKLYVPKVKLPRSMQWVGPVGTILLPALERSCPDKNGPLVADYARLAPLPPRPAIKPNQAPAKPASITIEGPLFPAIDATLGKRRIVVRSFSSIARQHLAQVAEGENFGTLPARFDEEIATPAEREDPLRGPVFGDMVHNVLERIDFAEVAQAGEAKMLITAGAKSRALIDAEVRANIAKLRSRVPREKLEEACRTQIATLAWQALQTPLERIGGPLCTIPPQDRLHEIEFHYPEHLGASNRAEEGFITGFMDLLFRANGRYYLVDFKTNLLAGYGADQLARSMDEADYHRQYRLYLHAVARWLKRVQGPRSKVEQQLGGVYYLYVRGMNGLDESAGVFFHEPTKRDLDLKQTLMR